MLKLLKKYAANYIPEIILNIIFIILSTMFQTVFLMGKMKKIIDEGVSKANMDYIWNSGLQMLIYTFLIAIFTICGSYITARLVSKMVCDIRRDCFMKVEKMSTQELNNFGTSTLFTRTMTDPQQFQIMLINIFKSLLTVPFIIIFMLISILILNKTLFLILFIMFVITISILVGLGAKSKQHFNVLQKKVDRINLLIAEKISGVRSIRAFRNQKLEEDKITKANQEVYDTAILANKRIAYVTPLAMVVMNWVVVVIYLVGTMQLKSKMANLSDLLLIFNYLGYFMTALIIIPLLENIMPKTIVAAERINELLDYKIRSENEQKEKITEGIHSGKIEFEHVVFGYSGATNVIADVTFQAQAGKTTAIIGATGSGKSTVMNLLTGLYEMNFGEIKIDGISLRNLDKKYLRSRISYCTQKAMVFSDTAYNNITAYNSEIGKERVSKACAASKFDEVVEKMEHGLQTVMSQRGMNLSGGQRQRLCLARCLAKDADIYVFDDTFSALDAKTEVAVRSEIRQMLKDKTVFVVAQKISTIQDADHIIVLDNGHIMGQGKHEDLLKTCNYYKEIYDTQCYAREAE